MSYYSIDDIKAEQDVFKTIMGLLDPRVAVKVKYIMFFLNRQ